eukprot:SAG11_NODE_1362_length_5110_cov_11.440830_1_plen_34_part_10
MSKEADCMEFALKEDTDREQFYSTGAGTYWYYV